MNILVICPMESEAVNFNTALQKLSNRNHHYKIQCSGVGKANAASTTALALYCPFNEFAFDLVVVVGYAAASSFFKQGEIIMPSSAQYHDAVVPPGIVEDLEKVYHLEGIDDATILTGDTFVDSKIAKSLIKRFGDKVLFDMEAASVSQIASELEIPVLVLKIISDVPDSDSNNLQSFEEFVNTHKDFTPFVSYLESI